MQRTLGYAAEVPLAPRGERASWVKGWIALEPEFRPGWATEVSTVGRIPMRPIVVAKFRMVMNILDGSYLGGETVIT